jgi:hypothetical protein
LPIVPETVIGKSVLIRPELELASSSNPWFVGTLTVTCPEDEESRHSRSICPSIARLPLVVEARTPPWTPRTLTLPELDDASTSPPPVWLTSMLPLLVRTVTGPLTPIPSIEPLPVEASNAPPTSWAVMPPDPVLARTRPPDARHDFALDAFDALRSGTGFRPQGSPGRNRHVVADRNPVTQVGILDLADADGVALLLDRRIGLDPLHTLLGAQPGSAPAPIAGTNPGADLDPAR